MSSTTEEVPLLVAPEYTVTVGEATSKADFLEAIKQEPCNEWAKLAIFTQEKKVLYSNFDLPEKDIDFILTNLTNHDDAMKSGIILGDVHYDVHRWYQNLIIGRVGISGIGTGIAILKWTIPDSTEIRYGLITYGFPTLSAKAVPDFTKFLQKWGNTNFSE